MSKNRGDELVDGVLELLLVPLYFAPVVLSVAGIGSLIGKEYKSGVLFFLSALIAYCLCQGIGKYFDFKKGIHRGQED